MVYSTEPIETDDLKLMAEIALADLNGLYVRIPRWAIYRERLLAVTLCQGAALHYLDHKHGVKDIDLWLFFAAVPGQPFPCCRAGHQDFGRSKFGDDPHDRRYSGRRIDIIGRSLPCAPNENAGEAIRTWLHTGSKSARFIRRRPIVTVYPPSQVGQIVWNGEETV